MDSTIVLFYNFSGTYRSISYFYLNPISIKPAGIQDDEKRKTREIENFIQNEKNKFE